MPWWLQHRQLMAYVAGRGGSVDAVVGGDVTHAVLGVSGTYFGEAGYT